jgi:signal transduction histidine kinase
MLIFISIFVLLLITLIFFLILSTEEKDKIELFHVMVHRVRSPSAIIRWYAELLSDKSAGTLNDKQKSYLSEIYKASERLNETIQDLAVLLQIQSNKLYIEKQDVGIKNLINKTLLNHQLNIEKRKLHLKKTYPEDQEIIVKTDLKLLDAVIHNIIENAIKHTPEEGNININIKLLNNEVLFEMKNDGYGISKIGESKNLSNSVNARDIGFNLYLAKYIIPRLGGKINFTSEESKGTKLFISLPA